MSDSNMTVNSTVASPEDARSPYQSAISLGPVDLRGQHKELTRLSRMTQRCEEELRTNARSQADQFLEWSKARTTENYKSIGMDLRTLLKSDQSQSGLEPELWQAVVKRIELMQEALYIAAGETEPDDSSSASASEGSSEMDE